MGNLPTAILAQLQMPSLGTNFDNDDEDDDDEDDDDEDIDDEDADEDVYVPVRNRLLLRNSVPGKGNVLKTTF